MSRFHKWKAVGYDCETFAINIWRCEYCGIFKTFEWNYDGRGARIIEYSKPDGEVIKKGLDRAPPTCMRGEHNAND